MTNQIERMKRIRLLLEDVPRRSVLAKKFIALSSLSYGVSARTIENYLNTLIDSEKIISEKGRIWKA